MRMSTHDLPPEEPELDAIERRTAIPMLILSALLVPSLILPLILTLPPIALQGFDIFEWLAWALFSFEYFARLSVARNKKHFFLHNLIDLATVILPLLRPLRLLSSARTLRLLRVTRIVAVGLRSGKQSERIVNHRSVVVTATVTIAIVAGCAALLYDIEHRAFNANILTVGDAFWCAISTVSSVGYGDRYPVTTEGRLIACVLMFIGTCLTGLIAAAFTSTFIEEKNEEEFDPQLLALRERLDRIDTLLERLEDHHLLRITPESGPSPQAENT
jgi:voltage-gated potassium channel